MENSLLFIHILCAAIWLGGAAFSIIFLLSIKNLSGAQSKAIVDNLSNLGKFVFGPVSLLVLISGIGLISVSESNFSFSDTWISLAFTGVIISIVLGIIFHPRAGRKVLAAIETDKVDDKNTAVKSWLVIAYIDFAVIASVLAVMVFKPGV